MSQENRNRMEELKEKVIEDDEQIIIIYDDDNSIVREIAVHSAMFHIIAKIMDILVDTLLDVFGEINKNIRNIKSKLEE